MPSKWCVVPLCTNTSVKTSHKMFLSVPNDPKTRRKWLQLARRDPRSILPHSNVFMCEDHFDLPNDMENYIQYRVMGSVSRIRKTPGCMPSKFECQSVGVTKKVPKNKKNKKLLRNRKPIVETLDGESGPASSRHTRSKDKIVHKYNSNTTEISSKKKNKKPKPRRKKTNNKKKKNATTTKKKKNATTTKKLGGNKVRKGSDNKIMEVGTADKFEDLPEPLYIIYRMYKFLHKEYELLKSVNAQNSCDLSPLSDVVGRTASAIGVIRETVLEILEMMEDKRQYRPELEHNYCKNKQIRDEELKIKKENTEDLTIEEDDSNFRITRDETDDFRLNDFIKLDDTDDFSEGKDGTEDITEYVNIEADTEDFGIGDVDGTEDIAEYVNIEDDTENFRIGDVTEDFRMRDVEEDFRMRDVEEDFRMRDVGEYFRIGDDREDFRMRDVREDFRIGDGGEDFRIGDVTEDSDLIKINTEDGRIDNFQLVTCKVEVEKELIMKCEIFENSITPPRSEDKCIVSAIEVKVERDEDDEEINRTNSLQMEFA